MSDSLDLLLNGELVAVITEVGPGLALGASLRYTAEAVERHGEGTILLSTALPVQEVAYSAVQTRYFLDGVLPEAEVRSVLAARARVTVSDSFGLLRAYGLDCAGAVQLVAPGTRVGLHQGGVHWLNEAELGRVIRDLPTAPLGVGVDDGVRASLGGVQGKLPVVLEGSRVGVPVDGMPSTHILKPARTVEDGREQWPGIVPAESFGLRVIEEVGRRGAVMRAAECRPVVIGGRSALLVSRFDRRVGDSGKVERVHQEDMAQALGILEKYQQSDTSPPSWRHIDGLLARVATVPALARRTLLEMVVVNTALGNCDFHAKNLSITIDRGRVELAPAYDVVPTATWQAHSRELALRVGGEFHLDDVVHQSLLQEAESWGMRPAAAANVISQTIARMRGALPVVLDQAREEGWFDVILDEIAGDAIKRLDRLGA